MGTITVHNSWRTYINPSDQESTAITTAGTAMPAKKLWTKKLWLKLTPDAPAMTWPPRLGKPSPSHSSWRG